MVISLRLQILLVGLFALLYLGTRWWRLERESEQNCVASNDNTRQAMSADALERNEPTMPSSAEAEILPIAQINRRPVLHPQIDCMVRLEMDAPCTGEFALSYLPATRRIGSKTWRVEGFNQATKAWELVQGGQTYEYFQAGIQIVNRHGALNDVEFSEFVVKASHLAESLGTSTEFPEMIAEVARARELEQFTREHDFQLTLHLHTKRVPWSLTYLQQHVKRAGFVAGVIPGRWVLSNSEHELIALTIDAKTAMADDVATLPIHKLSLLLDVPQVPRSVVRSNGSIGKPFDALCDVAIGLCASMEATIHDEEGLAVDAPALQRTAAELDALYDRLDAVDLAAGSSLARRLFS